MNISEQWSENLKNIQQILPKLAEIKSIASAFNANIDAIVNIDGRALSQLIEARGLSYEFLQNHKERKAETVDEVLCGIFKCFSLGIAEEWISNNPSLYSKILEIFKAEKMQIGGQGGIIANLLSICNVQNVIVHTNSLPKMQAEQFLPHNNLKGFDEKGNITQISKIHRDNDTPLIHIIFEFKKDDMLVVGNEKFICPKANRFILSCDELNQKLVTDENFMRYMSKNPQNYCFLSGFHLLSAEKAKEVLPQIKNHILSWKKSEQKDCIFHLEIASTSDERTLKIIVDELGKNVDSIGLNEREAIDLMGVLNKQESFAANAIDMFKSMLFLRKYTGTSRIELHMLGIFMTLQDKNFSQTPNQAKNGMLLASRIGSSRAYLGDLQKYDDLLASQNFEISEIGLKELENLADYIKSKNLLESGVFEGEEYDLIAIPTPLEKKPAGLVGMGDTISSISLIGAI